MLYVRSSLRITTIIGTALAFIGVLYLITLHNSPDEMAEERAFLQDEINRACALSAEEFDATGERIMEWNRRLERYHIRNDNGIIGDLLVPDSWVTFVSFVQIPTEEFCAGYVSGKIETYSHPIEFP